MVSRTVIVHTYAFKRVSALYVATPQRAGCDVGALNVPQDTRGASGIFKTSFTSHRVHLVHTLFHPKPAGKQRLRTTTTSAGYVRVMHSVRWRVRIGTQKHGPLGASLTGCF